MTSTRSDWGIPAALIALSLVPAIAGIMRVAQLAGGATVTPENARFVAAPLPVLLHIPSVVVFSILGALQFSAGLRRRRHGWHRAAGRILIPCGVVAALTGLWMTCVYPWPPGDGPLLYIERLVFGSAMLLSIARSVIAIRRRDFLAHGRWMLRAYAIGLGAGTQVLTHVPWFLIIGDKPGEGARAVMMGAGWVINVAVAEWIIRRERTRARTGDVSHRAMRRVVLGMTLLIGPAVASGQSHFRRTNPPGPHAVGLRVVEQYDLSRGYRGATAACTGNATRGARARPIQTLVWYPAEAGTGLVVTAGTYLRLGATADDFGHTAGGARAPGSGVPGASGRQCRLAAWPGCHAPSDVSHADGRGQRAPASHDGPTTHARDIGVRAGASGA